MPNYNRIYQKSVKQYVYWIERDSIGIALLDPLATEKSRFTSVDAALEITLFYHKKATHFNTLDAGASSMTEFSELPTQFHQNLVDKAISMGYEQYPNGINHAIYFDRKFEKGIKEGKSFKNRGRITGIRSVQQNDM
tara:strand:+ start:1880 stop:2290 length:411 start_codon:yes stop_codon:yes gene_type:complete